MEQKKNSEAGSGVPEKNPGGGGAALGTAGGAEEIAAAGLQRVFTWKPLRALGGYN